MSAPPLYWFLFRTFSFLESNLWPEISPTSSKAQTTLPEALSIIKQSTPFLKSSYSEVLTTIKSSFKFLYRIAVTSISQVSPIVFCRRICSLESKPPHWLPETMALSHCFFKSLTQSLSASMISLRYVPSNSPVSTLAFSLTGMPSFLRPSDISLTKFCSFSNFWVKLSFFSGFTPNCGSFPNVINFIYSDCQYQLFQRYLLPEK